VQALIGGDTRAVGAVAGDAADVHAMVELHAQTLGQRRFGRDVAGPVEQLAGGTVPPQDLDVLGRAVELLLGAKQLQGALGPLVVLDVGLGTQLAHAVPAAFGQPHHVPLVAGIPSLGAVAQHGPGALVPVDHRHLMPGAGQVAGAGRADDTTSGNRDSHALSKAARQVATVGDW